MVKKFLTQSAGYGVAEAGKQVVGLLLLPLYARFLTPEDYGIVSVLAVATGVLGTVLAWGMNSAVVRYVFVYTDEGRQRTFLASMTVVLLGSSLILCAAGSLFGSRIFRAVFPQIPAQPFLSLAVWSTFCALMEIVPMAYLWATERLRMYTSLSLCAAALRFGLIALMVVRFERGAAGKLEGDILAGIGMAAILGGWFVTKLGWRFSWRLIREPIAFGAPLVLHGLALLLLNSADRVLLQRVVSLGDVAVYALGYTLGGSINFFAIAMCRAWLPDFFSTAEQAGGRRRFTERLTLYTAVMGGCALALAALSPELVRLLAPGYAASDAARIMPYVAIGYLFFSMYYVGSHLLKLARTSWRLVSCTAAAAVLNIALNVMLIPVFGIWGAVWATLAAFLALWAGSWIASPREYLASINWKRFAGWMGAAVACTLVVAELARRDGLGPLALRAAIAAIYGLGMIRLFKQLHRSDQGSGMSASTDRARWIAMYDQALSHAAQVQTWPGHFLFKWVETQLVFRQVGISGGALGLELGCGNGFQSMLLASRCRQLISTDLLDADPHTHTVGMDRARRLLDQCGVRNVRLAAARAEALPFPDGQFDFVFSSSVLEHVEDRPKALAEMARVLKPEGIMIVAVPSHVASLCAFLHLPLYMITRTVQVIVRRLRRQPPTATERVDSARHVQEQDRARGLAGAWLAFWKNHPRFPAPEPHGTFPSVFQELRSQFPARWRALIEAGGFQVERSFALTLVPINLLEVFSPALMARAYQWSQPLHERTMTHPVAQSLGYIWAAVCRKQGAPVRTARLQRQEAVAG